MDSISRSYFVEVGGPNDVKQVKGLFRAVSTKEDKKSKASNGPRTGKDYLKKSYSNRKFDGKEKSG